MRRGLLCAALVTVTAAIPRGTIATLGETAASVTSDRELLSAVHRSTTLHSQFSVQEYSSGSLTVREFLSTSGTVFAVAWNGLVHPDLATLLGSFAGEYRDAAQPSSRVPGRRHRRVESAHVVVETWGHMRNLQGRAFVPDLVPPGVSLDDIR